MPYPPDYGGVFDLFYKLKSFHEADVAIHLHCFEYGRGVQNELNAYCETINYYKRKSILQTLSFRLPYIVSSRQNEQLLNNLSQDDHPILLEGIHSTYFLFKDKLHKKTLVRLHNVEYEYYRELGKATNNIFKQFYFFAESKLLQKYEKGIANKATFIAVNKKDENTYRENLDAKQVEYLPVFLPFEHVASEEGNGSYCLYHGNLSVPENEKAAIWLLNTVFDTIKIPFVIAGKNPSKRLENKVHKNKNTCLIANPQNNEMDELIRKAHIHILPSFNKTGIKIKLLNALFNGRFVIVNAASIEGTNLAAICETANTPEEYKTLLHDLFAKSFTEENILKRKIILEKVYNKKDNIEKLTRWIW